jgi:hypothetical protein
MHRVQLLDIGVLDALSLKSQLEAAGLKINHDFEWAWNPRRWDNTTGDTPGFVEFWFRDPALATFYQLKWARS